MPTSEPAKKPGRKPNSGWLGREQSASITTRVPNAMVLEIQRAAAHELVNVSEYVRAVLEEKLLKDRDP
jgi:predicted DNA binding CopG/RHH family protein